MFGAEWIITLIVLTIALILHTYSVKKLQQLHVNDRSGYSSDLKVI